MRFPACWFGILVLAATAAFGQGGVDLGQPAAFVAGGDVPALRIPVTQSSGDLRVKVELLDAEDRVRGLAGKRVRAGRTEAVVPLGFLADLPQDLQARLATMRLRVSLAAGGKTLAQRIVPAEVLPGAFELTVLGPEVARAGEPVPLVVRATEPVTGGPAAGLEVTARLGESVVRGRTGEDGYLTLELPALEPEPGEEMDEEVSLEAVRPPFRWLETLDLEVVGDFELADALDRPLCRPGETIHAWIHLSRGNGDPLENSPLQVEAENGRGDELLSVEVTTDALGVATADIPVPKDMPPGWLRVHVRSSVLGFYREIGSVRVTEAELPPLFLRAEVQGGWVLQGEDPSIEITVTTPSGGPVAGVPVAVRREGADPWMWKTPGDRTLWQGTTGSSGGVKAELSWEELGLEPLTGSWIQFRDVWLTARAEDPASGRTVRRRFVLRVSRRPLHVYGVDELPWMPGRPAQLLVTAWTPDGSPAQTEVTARDGDGRVIGRGGTGPEGIGKVTLTTLPSGHMVRLEAVREDGAAGEGEAWVTPHPVQAWAVPEEPLPAAGEPIRVRVSAADRETPVLLQLRRDRTVLEQRIVKAGPAGRSVVLPWRPEMAGLVWVTAVTLDGAMDDVWSQSAPVVYPERPLTLEITARPGETVPGGSVQVSARLLTGEETVQGQLTLAGVNAAALAAVSQLGDSDTEGSTFIQEVEEDIVPWRSQLDPRDLVESLGRGESARRVLRLMGECGFDEWVGSLSDDLHDRIAGAFLPRMQRQLQPGKRDEERYRRTLEASHPGPSPPAPADVVATLRRVGWEGGEALDPWGRAYTFEVRLQGRRFVLSARSAGPDGVPETGDELSVDVVGWRWLTGLERQLERAVRRAVAERGAPSLGPDTVAEAMRESGIEMGERTDPWGRPLRIAVTSEDRWVRVSVVSDGPVDRRDGRPWLWDDVTVASVRLDTVGPLLTKLRSAALNWVREGGRFPETETELEELLRAAGISRAELVDSLGRPLRVEVGSRRSWGDVIDVQGELAAGRRVEATSARIPVIRFLSPGRDGVPGTDDDVQLADLDGRWLALAVDATPGECPGACGVLVLEADDDGGQPLPGVTVTIERVGNPSFARVAVTGPDGGLSLVLPVGSYDVKGTLPGYENVERLSIPVSAGQTTRVTLVLEVSFAQEVMVASEESPTATGPPSGAAAPPLRTPRIRREFATSCLWSPRLAVDEENGASVTAKLPDDQTTWKIQGVAVTGDGGLATAETEVLASLPLEARLELPPRLTAGDRLHLRASVRNNAQAPARVRVEAAVSGALALEGEPEGGATVPGGGLRVWDLPVTAARAGEGKVRLTAAAGGPGDGVERSTAVEPDGRAGVVAASGVVRDRLVLALEVPEDVLEGTAHLGLTAYPGTAARAEAALESLLRLPGWCGEQRASRGLLALAWLGLGGDAHRAGPVIERSIDALRTLQDASGGFRYFAGGRPDPVLTAYAVRFLAAAHAAGFEVGDAPLEARRWLARSQHGGLWDREGRLSAPEGITLTVVRNLAEAGWTAEPMVEGALDALEPRVRTVDDPWVLASWALAAGADTDRAAWAVRRLEALSRDERGAAYWAPRHNLPLGGWGLAGRIETTALAVRALARAEAAPELRDRGLRFLDRVCRGGVWATSPATVAVLETLAASAHGKASGGSLEIVLDGREAGRLELTPGPEAAGPLRWAWRMPLSPGRHRLEVVRLGGDSPVPVDAEVRFVTPWPRAARLEESGSKGNLELRLMWPSARLQVGRPVRVRAHAERLNSRGFGMLLAEIGLTPGMDADPASCRPSFCEVDAGVVRFYLWPAPGGTDLSFSVTPTLAGSVHARPSRLSAFYDPTDQVILPPLLFEIEPGSGRAVAPLAGAGAAPQTEGPAHRSQPR